MKRNQKSCSYGSVLGFVNLILLLTSRLEWCLKDLVAAKKLLMEALEQFPDTPKLYLMMGQILQQEKNYNEARQYFSNGVSIFGIYFHLFKL